ncbi:glycosyltransferase family 2 protein [Streptomyces durbertensis]|uniref:Glycosyltransferase family 2 protein n=1 Tax=Streptomyces durbertensis TaxID=2448886 RepID=A0ABR6EKZ1_9ACTN|nr:glycosyltransferase family 2 protein [Streptomyces durbertensis]MBB1245994.1 glycosyltransferase family 2 protein [Streptomyces durbertensis]
MAPKLSVVVPFYNVRPYAADTLRSLADNADPSIEFLLVDDCSTDGTSDVLERAQRELPNSRLLRHTTNQGISQARNTGIDAAEGEHVTFLDGDDWYARAYLPELVRVVERLRCDFVRVDHVQVNGAERTVRRAPVPLRDTVLRPRDLIAPAHLSTLVDYPNAWSVVCRRELFDDGRTRFDTALRTCEDRTWTWLLHLNTETCASVGLTGVFYRRGVTDSLTQIRSERQLDFLPAHDRVLAALRDDPEGDRFLPKLVRTYCAMIAYHMQTVREYSPADGRRLRRMCAAALRRMPRDVLDQTLDTMDDERSRTLRRLRARKAA